MDLNGLLTGAPGWTLTNAYGINDVGQIVGSGNYLGQQHAFLLNPFAAETSTSPSAVPEPATSVLTGGALCLISILLGRDDRAKRKSREADE